MNEAIAAAVREAGVVGAGGAGFPTHVKIASPARLVIVNGAECEPLLRVDQQLMAVEAGKLVKGLKAVMASVGAVEGIIALKGKYKDACAALEKEIDNKNIKLFRLEDFFPAGDEQVMVYEATGRIVPEGGIPLKVGCVVSNVETFINVANALEGIPVTDTWITVTGQVPAPVTVKMPIGVSVREVLARAGVRDPEGLAVIDGGPMMGRVMDSLDTPVTKTTKGLIVLPPDHHLINNKTLSMEYIIRRSKSTCIQCALCSDMCPRNLLGHRLYPHRIMRSLNYLGDNEADIKGALLCCECGACELYACPMLLSPKQVNAAFKKQLNARGVKPLPAKEDPMASPVRDYRKIPSKRLVARLGLYPYDVPAPLSDEVYHPSRVCIPLKQHIGAAAVPVVEVGRKVAQGELIAVIPDGALGANVHASVSGTVCGINECIEITAETGTTSMSCGKGSELI